MPLVYVQRYGQSGPTVRAGATQAVTGNLVIPVGTVVEFDPSLFDAAANGPSTYLLFTYTGTPPSSGNLTYDPVQILETGYTTATFDYATAGSIYVTLS